MRYLLPAVLLASVPAFADEIVLRNGSRFSGIVTRSAGRVHIRMEYGDMSFAAVDVASVRFSEDPLMALERKTSTASSAQDWHEAALFAAQSGLSSKVDELNAKAIETDPDHAGARTALGYRKHEGRWMTEAERMSAMGFVRFGDGWISRTEADRLEARAAEAREREAAEAARAAAESARAEAELRISQAAAELSEARTRLDQERYELERERLEIERQREAEKRRRADPYGYLGRYTTTRGVQVQRVPYAEPCFDPCADPYAYPSRYTVTTRGGPGLSVSR